MQFRVIIGKVTHVSVLNHTLPVMTGVTGIAQFRFRLVVEMAYEAGTLGDHHVHALHDLGVAGRTAQLCAMW